MPPFHDAGRGAMKIGRLSHYWIVAFPKHAIRRIETGDQEKTRGSGVNRQNEKIAPIALQHLGYTPDVAGPYLDRKSVV